MPTILFLYATASSGHHRAAEAIQRSIAVLEPSARCFSIAFLSHHYPTIGPLLHRMYLDMLRRAPDLWDALYDNHGFADLTVDLRQFFAFMNLRKLRSLILHSRPDAIVCTQAIPAGFVTAEKRRGRLDMPLYCALTDYTAHPYWPADHVARYFVPDDSVRAQLARRLPHTTGISVTGIPIDGSFSCAGSPRSARKRLGLDPSSFTVLVMGGNHGLGAISDTVRCLVRSSRRRSLQIAVLTGHNKDLHTSLTREFSGVHAVSVFGHVKSVPHFMDAADLIVTKPGGITSAEALAKGLPMIITQPLPGQEERNAAYLVRAGSAIRCDTPAEAARMTELLRRDPDRLSRLRLAARAIARPQAAFDIALEILRSIT